MTKLLLIPIAILFALISNGQTKSPILLTDMLNIKSVGNITINKEGTKAAFTLTSIEPDENNKSDYKYVTQLYVINTAGNNEPVQLTNAKEGASQPAWSPDNHQLAFVRSVDGKPQVFVLSLEGGEARHLTKFKYGAMNPKWSPDGTHLIFSTSIPLNDLLKDSSLNQSHAVPTWNFEKPGFNKNEHLQFSNSNPNPNGTIAEIRAWLYKDEIDKKAVVLNKLNFQNEFSVTSEMSFSQLYIIDVNMPGLPRALTSGFYSFNNASFTPDGKHIILSGDTDSLENPDRSLENEIFSVDTDGKNLKKIIGAKGMKYNNAVVSPTGKYIAFQYAPTGFVSVTSLAIMPLNGKPSDMITVPLDRSKGEVIWSKDEKYCYFTASANGGVPLYRYNITSKVLETLTGYDKGITSFDVMDKKIVFSRTQVTNPSELFMGDANMGNEKQVSHFNQWVETKQLSIPEKRSFKNNQGMTVEYWVMKPANYKAGTKYPLLLEIHGGPSAMWGTGETSMWHEFQYFCSKGYGIVYSNPRGSGGYGLDFLKANVNDWGTGPTSDVITALDESIKDGWADTSKLLITGGSYAGYLTAWIISHDHRFKAACSQRGVYDLATFFGEGNAWRLVPNYFGGYPWEPKVKEILVRESPITYVQNITTPYIIFHGGSDRRTGFVQGEMMYRSLKVLGRPVEYVVHPNATHELTRSGDNRQRMDQLLRTYEFFSRYVQ